MSNNDQTIQSYDDRAERWMAETPAGYDETHAPLKHWIDAALAMLPSDARILEIGSANGRDALYMEQCGYVAERSDAAPAFVRYLRDAGFTARKLNVIHDDLGTDYDLIFANAVFPHFNQDDTAAALRNIYRSLRPGGMCAFNVKQGDEHETWVDEKLGQDHKRFMYYRDPRHLLRWIADSEYELMYLTRDNPGDRESHVWMDLILRRPLHATD